MEDLDKEREVASSCLDQAADSLKSIITEISTSRAPLSDEQIKALNYYVQLLEKPREFLKKQQVASPGVKPFEGASIAELRKTLMQKEREEAEQKAKEAAEQRARLMPREMAGIEAQEASGYRLSTF